jgi:hypothetical protein
MPRARDFKTVVMSLLRASGKRAHLTPDRVDAKLGFQREFCCLKTLEDNGPRAQFPRATRQLNPVSPDPFLRDSADDSSGIVFRDAEPAVRSDVAPHVAFLFLHLAVSKASVASELR